MAELGQPVISEAFLDARKKLDQELGSTLVQKETPTEAPEAVVEKPKRTRKPKE